MNPAPIQSSAIFAVSAHGVARSPWVGKAFLMVFDQGLIVTSRKGEDRELD
jgi:hypothetical protein